MTSGSIQTGANVVTRTDKIKAFIAVKQYNLEVTILPPSLNFDGCFHLFPAKLDLIQFGLFQNLQLKKETKENLYTRIVCHDKYF